MHASLKAGVALAVLAGPFTLAEPSLAQAEQSADARADVIVVTARRVEERLTDVPLAITSFASGEIEAAGIDDLDDIAANTPGLNFVPIIGEFLPTPQIRGVGQVDLFANEPNVAIFVDGVYQGAREGLNLSQLAVSRIEVVKGPQSAMYGRNSFAGAINIITQAPGDRFGGRGVLEIGQDGRLQARGTVSGPLNERVAARLSVALSQFDGSYDNASGGPDLGGADMTTLSGAVKLRASEALVFDLRGYYSDDEIAPPAASTLLPNCEPNAAGVNQAWCGSLPSVDEDSLSSHPDAYGQRRESHRWSLTGGYDFQSGWRLSSLSGYNAVTIDAITDLTRGEGATYLYNTNPALFPPSPSVFNAQLLRFDPEVEVSEFSQELRLDSPSAQRTRGGVGLFYYDFERDMPEPDISSLTPLPEDFVSFLPPFAGDAIYSGFFDGPAILEGRRTQIETYSVFGYVEHDFSARFTARAEARYSTEDQAAQLLSGAAGSQTFETWTGRITGEFAPTPSTLLYGALARGAKPGGFDEDNLAAPFGVEENLAYELGWKGELGDGRGVFDIALFYIDRTDVQTPLVDLSLAPPTAVTTNLGDAHSYGVEAELTYALSPVLDLRAGLAWTEAQFDSGRSSSYAQFSELAPDGDLSGRPMGRAPEWQLNASLDFEDELVGPWRWFWRADASYQSEQFTNPTAVTIVPERTLVNLRGGLARNGWRIEAYVENALDEDAPVSAFGDVYFGNLDTGALAIFPWRVTVTHPRRRLVGGRVSVEF